MNYHIGNMLIWQEFNDGNECPLCRIRNILETRLADPEQRVAHEQERIDTRNRNDDLPQN